MWPWKCHLILPTFQCYEPYPKGTFDHGLAGETVMPCAVHLTALSYWQGSQSLNILSLMLMGKVCTLSGDMCRCSQTSTCRKLMDIGGGWKLESWGLKTYIYSTMSYKNIIITGYHNITDTMELRAMFLRQFLHCLSFPLSSQGRLIWYWLQRSAKDAIS